LIFDNDCKSLFSKFIGIWNLQGPCLGWIPGVLGFSTPGNETWIWKTQIEELQKSFEMTLNSILFSWNWTSKIHFLAFAWAFSGRTSSDKLFIWTKNMRKEIPHFLIPMSLQGSSGEIWFWMKNWPKIENCGGSDCVG